MTTDCRTFWPSSTAYKTHQDLAIHQLTQCSNEPLQYHEYEYELKLGITKMKRARGFGGVYGTPELKRTVLRQ